MVSNILLELVLQLVSQISSYYLVNKEILDEAQEQVDKVMKQFRRGLITEEERYDRVISIWSAAKDEIQAKLMKSLPANKPNLHDE